MPIVIETQAEFIERHGSSPLLIGHRWHFADGAVMANDESRTMYEPPTDANARLRLQRVYVAEQLRLAEKEFNAAQSSFSEAAALASQYRNLPGPPANAAQILESIKATAEEHRATLAKIDAQLDETPQAKARRDREEDDANRLRHIRQLQSEIHAVKL